MQFCFDLHAMNVLQRGVRISPVTSVTTHTPDWCTCTRHTFLNDIVRILYFCIYFCTYAKCLFSSKRLLRTHTVTHIRTKTLSSILHYIHLAYMAKNLFYRSWKRAGCVAAARPCFQLCVVVATGGIATTTKIPCSPIIFPIDHHCERNICKTDYRIPIG